MTGYAPYDDIDERCCNCEDCNCENCTCTEENPCACMIQNKEEDNNG